MHPRAGYKESGRVVKMRDDDDAEKEQFSNSDKGYQQSEEYYDTSETGKKYCRLGQEA